MTDDLPPRGSRAARHERVTPTVSVHDKATGWGVLTGDQTVGYRRSPCGPETDGAGALPCPWRTDAPVGAFPPAVYRHSARTSYDQSTYEFGCHNSRNTDRAQICAGYLLRGAAHNLVNRISGPDPATIDDGGHELYPSYRDMAVANGVAADDPALARCRAAHEPGPGPSDAPPTAVSIRVQRDLMESSFAPRD